MGKQVICENATSKYGGYSGDEIRALLVKQQYPKGSMFVSQRELMPTGCPLEGNINTFKDRVVDRFPKFKEKLF